MFEDIFKAELAGEVEDKVLVSCPNCNHGITRREVIAKSLEPNTTASRPPVNEVEKEIVRKGSPKVDPEKVAKSKTVYEEVGPHVLAGSEFFQWVDTGEDARVADVIAKGGVARAHRSEPPIDRLRDPKRLS